MIKKIRKYLIPSLAILLILSNFSYATNLMLCTMKESDSVCACKHKVEKKFAGVSISKVKTSCCDNETVVLSNTNNLQIVKNEIPSNTLTILHYINSGVLENNTSNNSADMVGFPEQIPKVDIPITTSSLLI